MDLHCLCLHFTDSSQQGPLLPPTKNANLGEDLGPTNWEKGLGQSQFTLWWNIEFGYGSLIKADIGKLRVMDMMKYLGTVSYEYIWS